MIELENLRDIRLATKAVRERWPIKDEFRNGVINALMRIIVDPAATNREKTSAAKGILAAEQQNQMDQHKVIDATIERTDYELDAIAADLGIETHLIIDATSEATLSPESDSSSQKPPKRKRKR